MAINGIGRPKVRPPKLDEYGLRNPEYDDWMRARKIKRQARVESRIIPNIRLKQKDARQRVSVTSVSNELGLPRSAVKGMLPTRAKRGKYGSPKTPRNSTITLGRAVKLLNEGRIDESILKLLKL